MNAIELYDPSDLLEKLLQDDPRLRSPHTKKAYRQGVRLFNQWRGERPVNKSTLLQYVSELQNSGISANTINLRIAAVRWYARTVSDMAQDFSTDESVTDELTKKAARIMTVRVLPTDHGTAGRLLEPGELQALLQVCHDDKHIRGRRDAALFSLLWVTGMRRSELLHLTMENLQRSPEGYTIQIVRGKGGKSRTSYASGGAAKYLDDWLQVRGEEPGYVFFNLDRARKCKGALTGEGLAGILKRRCSQAGITAHTTLHDFRRQVISTLFDAGVDVSTIMKVAGHSQPTVTVRYDRRPGEKAREAVRNLYVPYLK